MEIKHYYYAENEQQFGPFTFEELKSKRLKKSTLVWADGMPEWQPADSIDELKEIVVPDPPPMPKKNVIPRCVICGKEYTDGTNFCPDDGGQVLADMPASAPAYGLLAAKPDNTGYHAQNASQPQPYIGSNKNAPEQAQAVYISQTPQMQQQSNGVGTAGFVLALISCIFSWVPGVGWVVWFLGLILSFFGMFKKPRGLAVAGFILSIIGLILLIAVAGVVAALYHRLTQ